jgi:predicted ATPase
MEDLRKTLDRIHYLGPLRTPAKRYYVTNLDMIPSLDPVGEFLPYMLQYTDKHRVWNVRPGQHGKVEESLSTALNGWLYYLREGKEVTEDRCDEIAVSNLKGVLMEFELKTVGGTNSYAMADSGFGYSQVLPILVRGLLAQPGDTLIIEQPELHLNPALQVRLADFLVAMTRAGKQVIIETHSEHIVNAIRVLTAEDESGELSSNCAIFFIDAEKDVPMIHELSIKPDGTVPDWPYNFFGEAASLTGRLLRAQKRFRKQAKKSQE